MARQQGGRTVGRGGHGLRQDFRTTCFCLRSLLQTAFAVRGSRAQVWRSSLRLAGNIIAFEGSCETSGVYTDPSRGLIFSTQSSSPGRTGHTVETRVAAHISCSKEESIPCMCLCLLQRNDCALLTAVSRCDYPTSIYAENTNCTHHHQRYVAHGFRFPDFTEIV